MSSYEKVTVVFERADGGEKRVSGKNPTVNRTGGRAMVCLRDPSGFVGGDTPDIYTIPVDRIVYTYSSVVADSEGDSE